ncbi:SH3 domain-containing protein [Vallitalea maricola]|uniref:Uncharacterized protein n=1 Tax=Vallitalea maricola TaxID=3074433 RepID=A0ACB5UKT4_9FIRM|nr:hypothetical protein AN2V17_23970 [Vallitalea sp. AN17-2]
MKKKVCYVILMVAIITTTIPTYAASIEKNSEYKTVVAYVASKYLKEKPNRGNCWLAEVVLKDKDSHLNVRAKPSTDGKIIGKLNNGDIITVYLNRRIPKGWSQIYYKIKK